METIFDRIRNNHQSDSAAIVEILMARGFLIEEDNEKYYLSDNAATADIDYLSNGLIQYSIGRVVDEKKRITKHRRCWDMGGSFKYQAFVPHSVEILIDENASVDNAIRFFQSSGRIGGEAGDRIRSWVEFRTEEMGMKPSVRELEPYVSFYVKAISACGVIAWESCDGNHKNGGKVYVHSVYPSNIWHECIWKYVVNSRFGSIPYIEDGIPFNQETQGTVYLKLYEIADYLYKNRWRIREVKRYSLEEFDKKYRHTYPKEQLEKRFRERCRFEFEKTRFAE